MQRSFAFALIAIRLSASPSALGRWQHAGSSARWLRRSGKQRSRRGPGEGRRCRRHRGPMSTKLCDGHVAPPIEAERASKISLEGFS